MFTTIARTFLGLGLALGSISTAALANPTQKAFPKGFFQPNATQGASGTAGPIVVVANDQNTESFSTVYTDVPGMQASIKIPSGKKAVLIARFSAETACVGTVDVWCSIRILVDGHEAFPATDTGYAFSTVNAGAPSNFMWQGNSMDRAYAVGSGTHKVDVQQTTTDASANTGFWLGERTLVVEAALQ